jgi:SAM-dependent methyltransferase
MARAGTRRPSEAALSDAAPARVAQPPAGATSDYIARNWTAWEEWAASAALSARDRWRDDDLRWGVWGIAESELQLLAETRSDSDIIELGCGTGGVPAWLARHGFRPVAVDFSRRQLETANRLQAEFDLHFPLIHANAEQVPYDHSSFDFAISEYGASTWCEPGTWLAEASRLLRPEGLLVFFTSGAILMSCTPPDGGPAQTSLVRDYFSRGRVEFPGGGVEFHLTHGGWVRALREVGLVLEDLVEVQAPKKAKPRLEFASSEWAQRWPSEEIWIARKLPY